MLTDIGQAWSWLGVEISLTHGSLSLFLHILSPYLVRFEDWFKPNIPQISLEPLFQTGKRTHTHTHILFLKLSLPSHLTYIQGLVSLHSYNNCLIT